MLVSKLNVSFHGTMQLATGMPEDCTWACPTPCSSHGNYRCTTIISLTSRRQALPNCREQTEKQQKKKCWAVFSDRQKHWKKETTGFIYPCVLLLWLENKNNYLGGKEISARVLFYKSIKKIIKIRSKAETLSADRIFLNDGVSPDTEYCATFKWLFAVRLRSRWPHVLWGTSTMESPLHTYKGVKVS